ncbi:Hypothetical_protein [Hexamita inflata]|uniref:Hypothetical_protein n=1 Tax=Hexamita inflata TaxID=28002 RepID=A0AA86UND5_9EUKA|nr:Hypothetical protein HINF_LOCUS52845 [Hexamita inflata]
MNSRKLDLKELAEATGVPLSKLQQLKLDVDIGEDFDVDKFMEKVMKLQDEEGAEEDIEEEEIDANPVPTFTDEQIDAKINEIMSKQKKEEITGLGEISFKYKQVKKLDLGLTADELVLLPDIVLDYLSRNGRVDLAVYRRLKDDKLIVGEAFDVSKVKPFAGEFKPLKEHQKRQNGTFKPPFKKSNNFKYDEKNKKFNKNNKTDKK